jgi:hypothetical protein
VRNLVNGVAYAIGRGTPLTCHLTILWRHAATFSPVTWSKAQTDLLDKMSRYLQRQGIPVCFAWAKEIGGIKKEHTHLLLHLPRRHQGKSYARLRTELIEFLIKAGSFALNGIKPARGDVFGAQNDRRRWGWACYLLKGISPAIRIGGTGLGSETLAEFLGIDLEQGLAPVPGKRTGLSQNLGPKARRAAGYVEVRDVLGLSGLLDQGARRRMLKV